jgi:hypothetical protein
MEGNFADQIEENAMNNNLANAIIATSFNIHFGKALNKDVTPQIVSKWGKADKMGLLRTYIDKAQCDLYTIEQAESAFAMISNQR